MTAMDDLRRRWERDPSSRVFLQLAEEHRRAGDPKTAAEVLKEGLEANPGYLSARVSLGRCLLELGDADAALGTLDSVAKEDGTHVVASRLLVETHLARGDAVRAKRQLENYRLLFSADPEIEDFQQRIEEMLLSEADDAAEEFAEVVAAPEDSASEDSAPEDAASEDATSEAAASKNAELAGPEAASSTLRTLHRSEGETLFSGLGDEAEVQRLDETFAGEGIFPVAATQQTAEADSAPSPLHDPEREAEAETEPRAAAPDAVADAEVEQEEVAVLAPAEELAAETDAEEVAVESVAGEPEDRWALEQDETHQLLPSDSALRFASEAPNALSMEDRLADLPALDEVEATPEEQPPDAVAAEPEISADEQETATLADLYLEQGHREEAERIFVRILERDPDNELARNGLAALESSAAGSSAAQPLSAEDLLAAGDFDPEIGLTDKKIHLLRSYLSRIQRPHVS